MTQGTHPLSASMINQLNRVDTISNNLANLNTVGFKEDNLAQGSFNSYLSRVNKNDEDISKLSYIMNTVPKIDGDFINSAMGSMSPTGNKLDFALNQSNKYFKVQNSDNKIEYTRDGQFKVLDGFLVNNSGDKVLDSDNNPISVEDEFVSKISVVSVNIKDLCKTGGNNYKLTHSDSEVMQEESNANYLVQGSIERSNTSPIKSMVELIDAQRRLEQSQKAISGIDDINKKVIESIGYGR